jgi:DNA polymerase-1
MVRAGLVKEQLGHFAGDTTTAKVAHNANFDMTVLAEYGVWLANLAFDTMVAAYLLGEKSLGLYSHKICSNIGENGTWHR